MKLLNKQGKEKSLIIEKEEIKKANRTDYLEFICPVCNLKTKKQILYFDSLKIKDLICSSCKRKKTCLERYGETHVSKLKKIKEIKKETCLKNFGYENPSQNPKIKEKKKKTCLKNFGVQYPQQNEEIKNTLKKNNLKKYGVDNISKLEEIKEKKKETFYNNFIINNNFKDYTKRIDYRVIPLFTKEEYKGMYKKKPLYYKWKCIKCGNEFEDNFFKRIPRCQKCFPGNVSVGEKEVVDFIKSIYKKTILENRRDIISPYELDIYLKEINLAIEYNGEYWHNLEYKKNNDILKKNLCEEKGISLITIWENDWINNKEEIKKDLEELIKLFRE